MENSDAYWSAYEACLATATTAGSATLMFWTRLIERLDDRTLDIEAAIRLISTWRMGVQGIDAPISRATAYRMIDSWRPIVADLRNPGHSA